VVFQTFKILSKFFWQFFFEFTIKIYFPKYFQNSFLVTKRTQVPTSSWRYNPVLYAYLLKLTKNCRFQFLLPQANGFACVDFGCTHPTDGLFWGLPIYLLGFFSKYECWVTDWIVLLYHFVFLGCHWSFSITRFYITMECKKQFIWLIIKMNFFL
jgi:hypothetical protein